MSQIVFIQFVRCFRSAAGMGLSGMFMTVDPEVLRDCQPTGEWMVGSTNSECLLCRKRWANGIISHSQLGANGIGPNSIHALQIAMASYIFTSRRVRTRIQPGFRLPRVHRLRPFVTPYDTESG